MFRIRRLPQLLAILVTLVGLVTLAGWLFNIETLKTVFPGLVSMKGNTAACFVLAGLSLFLQCRSEPLPVRHGRLAGIMALVVLTVGFLTFLEYISGHDFGLDQFLFRDTGARTGSAVPGRMSPATAINFALLGTALLVLDVRRFGRWRWPAEHLTLAAVVITLLAFIGYFYGVGSLYRISPYATIAVHTVIAFCLLSLGILFARPARPVMALFASDSPGGTLARRMLPAAVLVPLIFGWLRVLGERAGLYSLGFGSALFACVLMVIFTALVASSARALNRTEAERQRSQKTSDQMRIRLDGVISSAMDAIISTDAHQRIIVFNLAAEKMFGVFASDALGNAIERFIPARFQAAHARHVEQFGRTGARQMNARDSARGLRANGEEFPIEASISQVEVNGERLFTVILRDISERKQREAEKQKFVSLADQSSEFIGICDMNLVPIYANDAALRTVGLDSRADFARIKVKDFFFPEDQAMILEEFFPKVLREGRAETEIRFRHFKTGEAIWMIYNVFYIKDAADQPVGLATVSRNITDRKMAEQKLTLSRKNLRALAARLQAVREEERTRVAREIHDVLAQELTRIKFDLTWAGRRAAEPLDAARQILMQERLAATTQTIDTAIESVQRIATALRPVVLDSLGLSAAIEWQANDFAARTGIQCFANVLDGDLGLDRDHSTALFRILQESLTNVVRHAAATRVEIALQQQPPHIILTIHDNGRGIRSAELTDNHSLGLLGMRERAALLGGECKITGLPGEGTTVKVTFPLMSNEHPEECSP